MGWPHSTRNGIHFWAQRNEEEEWIAACAGAGQVAATRAFAAIEDGGPIDLVFSIGWAGALRAEIAQARPTMSPASSTCAPASAFTAMRAPGKLWLATSPKVADCAREAPPGRHLRCRPR